jgi:hypothetical protein
MPAIHRTIFERRVFVVYITHAYDVFENGKPLALHRIASSGDRFAVYSTAA